MEAISTLRIGARLLALTIAISGTAFAQSAGESFHKAGEQTESAGSGAGHAIVNAARGTATATKDTAITAKVKLSLHNDDVTKSGDIHVTTVEGIVTLRGIV